MRRARFISWLGPIFARFVEIRRVGGACYDNQAGLLVLFDRYLHTHAPEPPLRQQTLRSYVDSLGHLFERSRSNRISVVWQAVSYAARRNAPCDALPPRPAPPPNYLSKSDPRILSLDEVSALIAAARGLSPLDGFRPATYATLFGLLFATGMRIGEALALDVGDLDRSLRLLTVRRGKFGKTRALPLRESTVEALERYVRHPKRPISMETHMPIFVSKRQRRLSYTSAKKTFWKTAASAGLCDTQARRPRPHDLRHSFVLHRVTAWYAQGRDVNALLPALSTYLGHVSIENTRVYLRANGLLLEVAAARFETLAQQLDGVAT